METEAQPQPTAGISGKRLTIGVLVGLVLTGALVGYVLWSYSQLDQARAQTAEAWRNVSEPLSERYRAIELEVAKGVDEDRLSIAWAEKFRLAVDRYRTTAQTELQYATALQLEQLLGESELPPDQLSATSPRLTDAVEQLNDRLAAQQAVLDSYGCRMLGVFLNFIEPQPLRLAGSLADQP